MARDYKSEYERQKEKYLLFRVWLKREIAEKFKSKLKKENKRVSDFFRKDVDEYLKK